MICASTSKTRAIVDSASAARNLLKPCLVKTKLSVAVAVCAVLTGAMSVAGCSSSEGPPPDECIASGSEALKTCAAGATVKGVDVSYYQGNVSWSQVKGAGNAFAFVRISDGL